MSNIALQRIQRDFKEIAKNEKALEGMIRVDMVGESLYKLLGQVRGPPGTSYEGGTYTIDVEIPDTYPFHPPKMKFVTKIWHPNISSQTGAICLDILKDQWAASMTLRTVFLSLQALLCTPEPDDPQDAVVAKQFVTQPELFKKTARHWAQVYAGASGQIDTEFRDKIRQLKDMGVDDHKARSALSTVNWDVARATEYIFS